MLLCMWWVVCVLLCVSAVGMACCVGDNGVCAQVSVVCGACVSVFNCVCLCSQVFR